MAPPLPPPPPPAVPLPLLLPAPPPPHPAAPQGDEQQRRPVAPPPPLAKQNAAAVSLAHSGDHAAAARAFRNLLRDASAYGITHHELQTTVRLNLAAELMALRDFAGTLEQAEACLSAIRADHPAHARARLRQGRAMIGLGRFEEAARALEQGLRSPGAAGTAVGEALSSAAAEAAAGAAASAAAAEAATTPGPDTTTTPVLLLTYPTQHRRRQPRPLHRLLLPAPPRDALRPADAAQHPALAESYAFARAQEESECAWRLLHTGALPAHAKAAAAGKSGLTAAARAIAAAVRRRLAEAPPSGSSCVVLVVGSLGGVLAVAALRAGATLVCVAERSRYLAEAAAEVVRANGFADAAVVGAGGESGNPSSSSSSSSSSSPRCLVFHCRPDELALRSSSSSNVRRGCGARDDAVAAARAALSKGGGGAAVATAPNTTTLLPVPCDVIAVAGLLLSCDCPFASGCVAAAAHLVPAVGAPDATVVPRSVAVRARAASAATPPLRLGPWAAADGEQPPPCLRFDALDCYRWQPSPCLPLRAAAAKNEQGSSLRYLSEEREVFCLDLAAAAGRWEGGSGGERGDGLQRTDVDFDLFAASQRLKFNAVAAWWECEFADGSTARGLQPALHWLPRGEVQLKAAAEAAAAVAAVARPSEQQQHDHPKPQLIVPVVARHSGVALSFDVEEEEEEEHGDGAAPLPPPPRGRLFHLEPPMACKSSSTSSANRTPLATADREVALATAAAPRPPAVAPLALALASHTPRLRALCSAVARAVHAFPPHAPPAVLDARAGGTAALAMAAAAAGAREVVAAEAHPQLVQAARANVALNAKAVRVLHADAARLEKGGAAAVSSNSSSSSSAGRGFDLVVLDPCVGADPNSGAPLALLDAIRRRCMAAERGQQQGRAVPPPPRVVPSAVSVWAVGLEVLSSALVPGSGGCDATADDDDDGLGNLPVDLSPLDRYRWRGGAACSAEAAEAAGGMGEGPPPCRGALAAEAGWDPVDLNALPHVRLTRPTRVLTMDFEAALGGGGGAGAAVRRGGKGSGATEAGAQEPAGTTVLQVERAGTLNAVAYWAVMHLWPGVEEEEEEEEKQGDGEQGGGGASSHNPHSYSTGPTSKDPRGRALQYLESWADNVQPGDSVHLDVRLGRRCVRFRLLGVAGGGGGGSGSSGSNSPPTNYDRPLRPAPRASWLAPGSGIENPDVWAVRRCHEVLAGALQRAGRAEPGAGGGGGRQRPLLPRVWRDLFVLTRHAATLGLDPAVLSQTAQAVALSEELAVMLSGAEGGGEGDEEDGGGARMAAATASALVAPEILGVRGVAWG
jgi:predicted nicotinamide N-methyase